MGYEWSVNAPTSVLTRHIASVIVLRMHPAIPKKIKSGARPRSPKVFISFLILLFGLFFLGCTLPAQVAELGTSIAPTLINTPTYTPIPTSTLLPTSTPTPLPGARIHSAEHALSIGDWDTAVKEYQVAMENSADPGVHSAALLGIGRTRYESGNSYEAVQVLDSLVESYPGSAELPEAYFLLALSHSNLEHYLDAAQAYNNYLDLRPGVIDAYILDMRADALFTAGDYLGAATEYQNAIESDSILDQDWIELKAARSLALAGEYQAALDIYDRVMFRVQNDQTKALINLRKGQIYSLLGQTEQAIAVYLESVNNYPTAYDSYTALVALVDSGVDVDELQRGIVDYYAGQYGVALAALDRYLQSNPADPGTALYFSGLTNRALGGYQAAIGQWQKLIQDYPDNPYWDDAWEEMAYTQWANLDQYTLAIDNLLEFVNRSSDHERAPEFLYDAALIAERAERLEQAAEIWERVAAFYPAFENATRARFLAGITHYRLGDYDSALSNFQLNSLEAGTPADKAAAHLWIGKVQLQKGDEAAARSSWEIAANLDPTGYYSERARDLLFGREAFSPPGEYDTALDWAGERQAADTWLRNKYGLPETTDLSGLGPLASDPRILRANELWSLGMYSLARNEYEALRISLRSDPVGTYRLMNYLLEIGLYRSAILASRQILDHAGMDDAATINAPAYFNHIRFGTYYSDLIIPIAQEYNFHPLFLYSVIRQESLFESFVRSSASASGLMQIMPGTGADIASNMGWPLDYKTEDLFRPVINLTFGAEYLDKQRNLYSGDLFTALAAYNGGPGNAREWKKLAPRDPDLFLEVIGFSETRLYIRSIYEIFNLYRMFYDRTP